MPWPWPDDDPHGNFPLDPTDTLASVVADYLDECERSRDAVAGASLDEIARSEGMDFNLRYALVIEETARHCGHADSCARASTGRGGE